MMEEGVGLKKHFIFVAPKSEPLLASLSGSLWNRTTAGIRVSSPQGPSYLFHPRGASVEWLSTLGKFSWKVDHCDLHCKIPGDVTRRLSISEYSQGATRQGRETARAFLHRKVCFGLTNLVHPFLPLSNSGEWNLGVVKYDKKEQSDKPLAVCSPAARSPGNLPELKPLSIVPPPWDCMVTKLSGD